MIKRYDLTKDVRYQQGFKKGFELGEKIGAVKNKSEMVSLIIVNCPWFSSKKIARLAGVTIGFVKQTQEALQKKQHLEHGNKS